MIDEDDAAPWVLLVDKDVLIRRSYERLVRGLQIRLRSVASAEAALALIGSEGPPALLISAYRLPGLDGLGFLATVRRDHPSARLVLSSGAAVRPPGDSNIDVLPKPVEPDGLRRLLASLASSSAPFG